MHCPKGGGHARSQGYQRTEQRAGQAVRCSNGIWPFGSADDFAGAKEERQGLDCRKPEATCQVVRRQWTWGLQEGAVQGNDVSEGTQLGVSPCGWKVGGARKPWRVRRLGKQEVSGVAVSSSRLYS